MHAAACSGLSERASSETQPQKAVGQDAAFEEGVELVLDELRQIGAGSGLGLGDEGRSVLLHRYFGLPRDAISLDAKSPPGVPSGVAGVASSKLKLTDATSRPVIGVFNAERLVGRTWPVANNEISYLELMD